MDMSVSSEYSVFDKLYASEAELETTDNDTLAKTDSRNGSESSTFSAHQSDTSEGTGCYLMSEHQEPGVVFTDLHISTDIQCPGASDEINGSVNALLESTSSEEQKSMQISTTAQQETEDRPTNMQDSISSVRAGYITY